MRFVLLIILFTFSLSASTYTDMYKRDVQIEKNQKIVCLGPGTLRIISYLQLQNRLVGVEKRELSFDKNSPYSFALDKNFIKSLPIVGQGGPGKMPNLETLLTLKPDIIFTTLLSKEQVELIQKRTNIPVVALSYGTIYNKSENKIETIKKSIKLVANIMDKNNRANQLLSFMKNEETKLSKIKITNKNIYIGGVSNKGVHGITSTESNYPAFTLLNIKNSILKDHIGHAFIDKETLFKFNPDVVFLDSISKKLILEEIKKDQAIFKHIKAFKQNNIYWLSPSNFYNTNIENIYINSWKIASYFGKNIDINLIKKRVYKTFLGKEILEDVQ